MFTRRNEGQLFTVARGEDKTQRKSMMTRLFASAVLVVGLSQAALAQSTAQQNQPSTSTQPNQPSTAENAQAPQNLPQSLRQRLTSAGFSDVNIVPSSFVITARDKNGRPVMMRITPNSMTFLTEIPADSSSTTGTATEGQSR
jgi:hypothetical protein